MFIIVTVYITKEWKTQTGDFKQFYCVVEFPFFTITEELNHNYFMLKRKVESTFVITYLIVLISVNSVISTVNRWRNLIYLVQWDVACFYRNNAALHDGKSDDRTD
jgi:hypothetical protein